MSKKDKNRLCPVEEAGKLDSFWRKFLQNPRRILNSYINPGMTVLDMGCGPGFFTVEIARMLKGVGKVIAADLQDGMLEFVKRKIKNTELESIVELHKCDIDKTGISKKVDFILAFYMIHEVPNQDLLFSELKSILNPNGMLYIIEPKFHVSKESFSKMVNKLVDLGFNIVDKPRVFYSRTILLRLPNE